MSWVEVRVRMPVWIWSIKHQWTRLRARYWLWKQSGEWINAKVFVTEVLEKADRIGADTDDPEGSRYIQISETLVNEMLAKMKKIHDQ